jgi:hypothetical protein
MAGTLVVDTISNGTVSTSSENVIQGSAKAWVNFDGVTTATIRSSYNVSSVTRNAASQYTVNFTNAMPDANYCINGAVGDSGGQTSGCWFTTGFNLGGFNTNNTTSSFRVQVYFSTSQTTDVSHIYASVFR